VALTLSDNAARLTQAPGLDYTDLQAGPRGAAWMRRTS